MTKLTIEQMREIIDGVTDECATHISPRENVIFSECIGRPLHNINDLRTIIAQQQEIERLREQNDKLKSDYGDNWYDGFIAERNISRDRFSDLECMDDSEILGLSENAEQAKAKGESE